MDHYRHLFNAIEQESIITGISFLTAVTLVRLRSQLQRRRRTFTPNGTVLPTTKDLCLKPAMTDDRTIIRVFDMEKRSKDVFIVSFPKSGTHLISFACWQLLTRGKILERNIHEEVVLLDRAAYWHQDTNKPFASNIGDANDRRVFFTHLSPSVLLNNADKDARFVYVVRDVRDVVMSYYPMLHAMNEAYGGFPGDVDEFVDAFCENKTMYGTWAPHVQQWIRAAESDPRILVIRYEEFLHDKPGWLWKLNQHIHGPFSSQSAIEQSQVMEHISFQWMKEHNGLFQSGTKAAWRESSKFQMINKGQSEAGRGLSERATARLRQHLAATCPKEITTKFLINGEAFINGYATSVS